MDCNETTSEGTRVKESTTGKNGTLVKGPAGVVWISPTNSCWVQFDGEADPKLVPCQDLEVI